MNDIGQQLRDQGMDVDGRRLRSICSDALRESQNRPLAVKSVLIKVKTDDKLLRALVDAYLRDHESELRGRVSHSRRESQSWFDPSASASSSGSGARQGGDTDSRLTCDRPAAPSSSAGSSHSQYDSREVVDRPGAPSTPAGASRDHSDSPPTGDPSPRATSTGEDSSRRRRDRRMIAAPNPRPPQTTARAGRALARATVAAADTRITIASMDFILGDATLHDLLNLDIKIQTAAAIRDAFFDAVPRDRWPDKHTPARHFMQEAQLRRVRDRIEAAKTSAIALAKELTHG